jgi:hypothetical protein
MGVPFDAQYEHANEYDYEYEYEYDYDHTSRNARKIIHTKAHANTMKNQASCLSYASRRQAGRRHYRRRHHRHAH